MEEENVRISQIEAMLDEYTEEKLLLRKIKMVDARLDITTKDLALMNSEQLNEWRFEIAQYLAAIQKDIGKHKSRLNWAERNLRYYLSLKVKNNEGEYKGYGFEEKKMDAMRNDNYAKKLNDLAARSQMALERLEFMPQKIAALVDIAKDMIWARKKESYKSDD